VGGGPLGVQPASRSAIAKRAMRPAGRRMRAVGSVAGRMMAEIPGAVGMNPPAVPAVTRHEMTAGAAAMIGLDDGHGHRGGVGDRAGGLCRHGGQSEARDHDSGESGEFDEARHKGFLW